MLPQFYVMLMLGVKMFEHILIVPLLELGLILLRTFRERLFESEFTSYMVMKSEVDPIFFFDFLSFFDVLLLALTPFLSSITRWPLLIMS